MSLVVHAISGAPRSWRVLVGLAFKNLDYTINYLEASKAEHKSPDYLKIHPRGTVPALEGEGLILRDSIGILAWLDRQYPGSPLFGETPEDAGNIWQITLESADYLRSAHQLVFFSLLALGEEVPAATTAEGKAMREAADDLRKECGRLETLLRNSDFLYDGTPSAADAVAFPEIRLIQRAAESKPQALTALGLSDIFTEFPRLAAWTDRVEHWPGMEKTMPPHWEALG